MSEKQKSRVDDIQPLPMEAALEKLLSDEKLYVFGHGTADESKAEEIMHEGLHLRRPHLWSTVAGLPEKTEVSDHIVAAEKMIQDWPHRALKYVVAVGVERLPADKIPHRRYLQSIVQDRPNADEIDPNYGSRYTVDPRFIAGYFNADSKTFMPNPDFDPTYDPSLLETTADGDIKRENNPLSLLKLMDAAAGPASNHEAEFIELDSSSKDTPLKW